MAEEITEQIVVLLREAEVRLLGARHDLPGPHISEQSTIAGSVTTAV